MIEEISFDTSSFLGLIDQSIDALPLTESPPPPSTQVDNAEVSLRSSQRKLRESLFMMDPSATFREYELKAAQNLPSLSPTFYGTASASSNAGDISADLKKYFLDKMKKKDVHEAEKVFDRYLKAGFSPKAAIALTDRKFFPAPHEAGHGNYLKNVIGDELFQKEQAARKGKEWIHNLNAPAQVSENLKEKIKSTAIKTLDESRIKSKTSSNNSKKPKYTKQMSTRGGEVGQYVLGLGEMAVGVGLMAAGVAVEIGTLGVLTIGVAFEEVAAAALVADGFARTMRNRDISVDRHITPATWNSSDAAWKNSDVYAPDKPLPRDPKTGHPQPETDAPHTELGTKDGDKGKYPQAREFDGDGNWVRDIDFTDHCKPHNHPCPHQHEYKPNITGGTPERDKIAKPVEGWEY